MKRQVITFLKVSSIFGVFFTILYYDHLKRLQPVDSDIKCIYNNSTNQRMVPKTTISSLSHDEILEILRKSYSRSRQAENYAINLGSGCYSNTLEECVELDAGLQRIIQHKWSGLLMEARSKSVKMLQDTFQNRPDVIIVNEFVLPHTINKVFETYNVPKNPKMLKIDIGNLIMVQIEV